MTEVLLYLIAQGAALDRAEWYQAVDDVFDELSELEKWQAVDAGQAMLMRMTQHHADLAA